MGLQIHQQLIHDWQEQRHHGFGCLKQHLDILDRLQLANKTGDQTMPPLRRQLEFELRVKKDGTCCS